MPIAQDTPQSLDPAVPGTGRPLRVGDWVWHTGDYRSGTTAPAVITNFSVGLQVRSPRPDEGFERANHFDSSYPDQWRDDCWHLLWRPDAGSPRPTLRSLSGDFQVGDIVQAVQDPVDSRNVMEVTHDLDSQGRVTVARYGEHSSHMHNIRLRGTLLRLVHRPTPESPYEHPRYVPPALLKHGMQNEWVDMEFIDSCVAWVLEVQDTPRSRATLYPASHVFVSDRGLNQQEAIFAVKRFICGQTNMVLNTSEWSLALDHATYGMKFREPATMTGGYNTMYAFHLRAHFTEMVTRLMNASAAPSSRCVMCSLEGSRAILHGRIHEGYPDSGQAAARAQHRIEDCRHYTCASCGRVEASWCPVCPGFRADDFVVEGGIHICLECCDHTTCPCGGADCEKPLMRKGAGCEYCNKADKCCKCEHCEVCGKGKKRECCGGCAKHCMCSEYCMRLKPFKQQDTHSMEPLHKWEAPAKEKGMTRLLGTEVETLGCETYSPLLRAAVHKWKASVVTDGSVGTAYNTPQHHEQDGVELVTQPAGGSQWVQMIAELGAGFKESKAITNASCGLHVHVNAADMGVYEMARLIQLYAHLEGYIFGMLPKSRDDSQFSKRCGPKYQGWLATLGAKLDKKSLSYAQYGLTVPKEGQKFRDPDTQEFVVVSSSTVPTLNKYMAKQVDVHKKAKYDQSRYNALNLHSYWHRGTIEFRHHHGTNDPVKITNWGLFVGGLVDWCVKHSDQELAKLLTVSPNKAILDGMDYSGKVAEWIQSRWDLFLIPGSCVRRGVQPVPNELTGEI